MNTKIFGNHYGRRHSLVTGFLSCTSNLNAAIQSALMTCVLLLATTSFGQISPSEQNISDAILNNGSFSTSDLFEFDQNFDGRVDVADLVFFLNGSEFPLDGYQWLVSATFGSDLGERIALSYDYEFALTVNSSGATVSALKEFNPTKDLLRQNISGPGQDPGELRSDYSPTALIPVGTTFSVTPSIDGFVLTSAVIPISPADSINPSGESLSRTLTLTVSTEAASSSAVDHGTLTDRLVGFPTSGSEAVSVGTVRLTRYAPEQLLPLEDPNP
ncbi:MAG: hypothetical protein AB8G18_08320 [Gammaproteobacteria bacterium]